MGLQSLGNRAVIGRFFNRLEAAIEASWFPSIVAQFDSDQAREDYPFLGSAPAMREWVGGRHAKAFSQNIITIENRHYEATLDVSADDLRRDKTGQIMTRIIELADRAATHPQRLITDLIENGHAARCYDGAYFFSSAHVERDNITPQSNDLTIDTTTLGVPLTELGTPAAPSDRTLAAALSRVISTIKSIRDDQNEPMNENASRFLVMVPTSYLPALANIHRPVYPDFSPNLLRALKYDIRWEMNPRLTWTDKFAVFRTDGGVKPFLHQVETMVELKAKAAGSEYEFNEARHAYGVDQAHNVGYGYWQSACRVTLT